MTSARRTILLSMALLATAAAAELAAHLITYRGTVLKVEAARIQVKAVAEDGADIPEPLWFVPTEKTKILRGDRRVSLPEAAINAGERIVVIVEHSDDDKVTVIEIRLAEARQVRGEE